MIDNEPVIEELDIEIDIEVDLDDLKGFPDYENIRREYESTKTDST